MDWGKCVFQAGNGEQVATLNCLPILFQNIVNAALIFAGITAVIFIIIAGFKMINSGGDPKQVDGARKTLTFAIAGLIIILGSFFIIRFIATITHTECITKIGYTNCQ